MSGINLTPFGHAGAPAEPNQYMQDAFGRAEIKLNALRARVTHERPAGSLGTLFIGPSALCVMGALPALLIGFAILSDSKAKSPGAALIFLLIGAALIGLGVWLFVSAKPDTPKKALKYYFKAVAAGKGEKAASLVASNDFDDFPRFPPQMSGFGQSAVRPFFNGQFLGGYWNELVRYHSAPYCIASLHRVREQQIAPDLMIVDCEVRFIMNTQLWLLLIFVALLIALIADMATRKTVKIPVRKLLYRVGNEWKLFNGELQGPEELDLRWLTASPAETGSPYSQPSQNKAGKAPWE